MELELVDWLKREFGEHSSQQLGIGDDAALLEPLGDRYPVVTHDTLVDHVHFDLKRDDPALVGRKAVAVNLSDLAAMAAEPVAVVIGIVLPRRGGMHHGAMELAKSIYRGMKPILDEFNVALAGGDTNSSDGPLTIGVTAIGKSPMSSDTLNGGCWTRSGAVSGDQLIVTGDLGGSILGKHLRFVPRIIEALALRKRHRIHAAMDISDGLLLDLNRMCLAGNCGAVIELDSIPISAAAKSLAASSSQTENSPDPLTHAISDGEDFELLLAVSAETWENMMRDAAVDFPLTRIGEIISQPGLFTLEGDGEMRPIAPKGFVHEAE